MGRSGLYHFRNFLGGTLAFACYVRLAGGLTVKFFFAVIKVLSSEISRNQIFFPRTGFVRPFLLFS